MNFKTTFILLIIFIAIGVYLFFSSRGGDGDAGRADQQLILDVPVSEVTKIAVLPAGGERLLMEKTGGEWRILQPVQAKAAKWQAEQLASAIVGMKRQGSIDRDEADAARTVTEKPAYSIELTTADGRTRTISVGQKSLVGNTTYVQIDGKGRVYVVSGEIHDQLARPASDYRETQLVDAAASQLQRIEIDRGDEKLALARQDGNWQVAAPTTMPAERPAVDSLAGTLTALRASEFAAADVSPIRTGLASPRLTVRFSAEGREPATVKIGNYTDLLRKQLYAQVGDGPVATITSFTYDALNKGLADLRSREVMRVDAAKVSAVSIAYDLPATTQPATRPARTGQVKLTRKPADVTLGPALPATQPATAAATRPATAPATASATQPAAEPKWIAHGRPGALADEDVEALLRQFDPLRASRFVNGPPGDITGRYTVRLTIGQDTAQQVELIQPASGPLVARHQDTLFEVDPALADAVKKLAATD
jgi:hypothetical protein